MKKTFLMIFALIFVNFIFMSGVCADDSSWESSWESSSESSWESSGESSQESSSELNYFDPTETVNKSTVGIGQEFIYTIYQEVPYRTNNYYYDSFVVENILEDCLVVNSDNISVADDTGRDVTNLFDIAVEGQKITFTLLETYDSSFYDHVYSFIIKTHIKSDADLGKYKSGDKYIIQNVSTVIIDDEPVETNYVYVNYVPEVINNVPITSSMASLCLIFVSLIFVFVGLIIYINLNAQKNNM